MYINLIKFKNILELAIKYRTIVGFDFLNNNKNVTSVTEIRGV